MCEHIIIIHKSTKSTLALSLSLLELFVTYYLVYSIYYLVLQLLMVKTHLKQCVFVCW